VNRTSIDLGTSFSSRHSGDLDCLGTIDNGKTYEDLIDKTVRMNLGGDRTIDVLELRTLIEVTKRAGRPKDLAAIPVLEATLDEIEGRD
jgi:hypothetical protein